MIMRPRWGPHIQHMQPPAPTGVVADLAETGLGSARREQLAIALHERWHGAHTPDHGKAECARRAGCFEDVAAIEALILSYILAGRPT